ncbi:MAG: lipopolysaccharide assembly protein LapA domain-containing protein [Alphaproteobacteria bacterium]|nr:lipopolysaccharide assembly protein LapA domain-containing protein [Alphaproteobacteria bacterium]
MKGTAAARFSGFARLPLRFVKFVISLVGVCGALIIVAFAVANRESAPFVWSPFHPSLDVPLYIPPLVCLFAGFLAGGFFMWFKNGPLRRENRRRKKNIRELEAALENMKTGEEDFPPRVLEALPGKRVP